MYQQSVIQCVSLTLQSSYPESRIPVSCLATICDSRVYKSQQTRSASCMNNSFDQSQTQAIVDWRNLKCI